ncbi:hypothetical protein AOQ84DRAFT_74387 [Glonium stellatum]|uniref:NADH dehydrogenase [ubiquinone] 1 alpha subcomplex subunit n=1 Tax=Glonium stellatum TaxID=574774 RepID=A0A8E2EYA1_9PEZI|nr:hypothetical protein AOQ84DRAFT_74387 [Glonium stellatum]
MPSPPGSIRSAWYKWKMLRLPWRKRWLIGFDLSGNTFWEFKDSMSSNRLRRIAKYSRRTHYGDVNVSPQWMQWLRHTRFDPPSLVEQQADQIRQEQIKVLAAAADERWASKPSVLDPPEKQQPIQMLTSRDPVGSVGPTAPPPIEGVQTGVDSQVEINNAFKGKQTGKDTKESSWKKNPRSGPSEDWQPESWTPAPARRRA